MDGAPKQTKSNFSTAFLPHRTTLLLLLLILVEVSCTHQHFTTEPSSITANLGDAVTLPCTVADRKGMVQWTKDGFGLGTNRTLHGFDRYEMIGSVENGEYNLYIRMVLASDDAEYQCQVSAGGGDSAKATAKAKLTVHVPPKNNEDMVSIDRTSPVTATAGTPIRMSCIARSSKPAPEIQWFNGDKEITSGTNKTTLTLPDSQLVSLRKTLDLTPSKDHNLANISCQVTHVALEEPIIRSVIMEVTYPPIVSIAVDSAKIKEGDDVTFTCTAEGNPNELQYQWEVGGVKVAGEGQGPEFVLDAVSRKKNKVDVKCIVTNRVGTSSAKHNLSVEFEPVFKSEPLNVDGDLGKTVTLKCDVDGNPNPEIVWTHKNSAKVIKLGPSMTVVVSPSTVGTYTCRATVPGFGEEFRSIEVFARGPPQVLPDQAQYGLEGTSVTVVCAVHAIPRPTESFWSRAGIKIYPSDKYIIKEDPTPSGIVNTLTINNAHYEDFGAYNCSATNEYGSDIGLVHLHRQQSLPLITTLVAIIGGIIFLVIVVAAIVIFRRKGLDYKDSGSFEKHSMHSNDHSSTNDSVLKVETRTGTFTGTASDLSPSDDDDDNNDHDAMEDDEDGYNSNEEWTSTNLDEGEQGRMASRSSFRYSADMDGQNNTSGAYVPYVDYQRDYNPPPPPPLPTNYNNRNTIYTSVPLNNIGVDPRFNLSYGNLGGSVTVVPSRNLAMTPMQRNLGPGGNVGNQPTYLRLPANARIANSGQNVFGSSGTLVPQNTVIFNPNLGPPNTNFGANVGQATMNFGGGGTTPAMNLHAPSNIHSIANNLNDASNLVDKNAIYSQLSRNRSNLRNNSNVNNSQYISIPQNDLGRGGLGTHI